MSENSAGKKKINLLKLGIIPLLVGVLGYVVWSNQPSAPVVDANAATAPASLPPPALAMASPTPSGASDGASSPAKKQKRVAWPKYSPEQILATNPFRGSTAMQAAMQPPEAAIAKPQIAEDASDAENRAEKPKSDPWVELVASLKSDAVGVYLETSKGPALKVGGRVFKVGDSIGDGYRVTAVGPEGIVVEAVTAKN